jgi:hypothetical protein
MRRTNVVKGDDCPLECRIWTMEVVAELILCSYDTGHDALELVLGWPYPPRRGVEVYLIISEKKESLTARRYTHN